jgi:hypothetical protein
VDAEPTRTQPAETFEALRKDAKHEAGSTVACSLSFIAEPVATSCMQNTYFTVKYCRFGSNPNSVSLGIIVTSYIAVKRKEKRQQDVRIQDA